MVSTAGLEPARVSPHAPQTCAYTDSATSTSIFNFQMSAYTSPLLEMTFSHFSSAECHVDINIQFSNVCVYLPSRKTILNRFSRQSATSTSLFNFQQKLYYHKHNFCKNILLKLPMKGLEPP